MRGEQKSRGDAALDPHAKSEDFSLRPDPSGARDPIGDGILGGDSDLSLRADPTGEHDPLGHTHRDGTHEDVSDRAAQAASTVGARVSELADKAVTKAADLAGSARAAASEHVDAARTRAADAYDGARTWVADTHDEQRRRATQLARRGQARIDHGRGQVGQFVEENPLLVGVVGVAAGLLLGALIPRTRGEDRSIGPYADEFRAQGLQYARDATDRGRAFVESALDPDKLNAAGEPSARGSERDERFHTL